MKSEKSSWAALPIDTKPDNCCPLSRIAEAIAPDCEMKAILQVFGIPSKYVVLSFWNGSIIPYEFGPRRVMFAFCAICIIRCSSSVSPISEKPADNIIADFTFRFWDCLRISGTNFAGTAITTQSIWYGISKMSS